MKQWHDFEKCIFCQSSSGICYYHVTTSPLPLPIMAICDKCRKGHTPDKGSKEITPDEAAVWFTMQS